MSKTHVLSLSSPGNEQIPNCCSKSHSQGRPSATKLFLRGSARGWGSSPPSSGFHPTPSLLAPGRHQVRAHSGTTEPQSATSSESARRQEHGLQTEFLHSLLLSPPRVPRTTQKLFQPPHPKRNCLFLSKSKLLQ